MLSQGPISALGAAASKACVEESLRQPALYDGAQVHDRTIMLFLTKETCAYGSSTPKVLAKKAHWSATSSMILAVGVPAPWPARAVMRRSVGAAPA